MTDAESDIIQCSVKAIRNSIRLEMAKDQTWTDGMSSWEAMEKLILWPTREQVEFSQMFGFCIPQLRYK